MTGTRILLTAAILIAAPAFAQRDFLTNNEADKVREVQEPNQRLQLYVLFARQRLDQLQSTLTKNKTGRSADIRTLLEEYTQIIDAIGSVSEDALSHRADLTVGSKAVIDAETKFLAQLKKLEDSAPSDGSMYDFQLREAIIATGDSIDMNQSDQAERTRDAVTKAADDRQAVIDVVRAEEEGARKGPAGATGSTGQSAEAPKPAARRPPTIYRPGEQH